MSEVYALLKDVSKGMVTFHGITNSEVAAKAWTAAGPDTWYYPADADDTPDPSAELITRDSD